MADTSLNVRIKNAYKTETEWTQTTTVPKAGETMYTNGGTHDGQYKIGDGIHTWSQLNYVQNGSGLQNLEDGSATGSVRGVGTATESTYNIGRYAFAEGSGTQAWGEGSHAEGNNTIAFFTAAHAEGEGSYAQGYYSHAEGYYTEASGTYSHASGYYTIANSKYQTVIGMNNIPDTPDSSGNGNYLFIVGNGTSAIDDYRSNAFGVLKDGNTVQFVDVVKGSAPSAQKYSEVRFKEKNGTVSDDTSDLAKFGVTADANGSYRTYIRGYYPIANNSNSANITITTLSDGSNWIDLESWVNVLGGHLDICSPNSGVLGFRYNGAASATATITNTSGSTLATNGNFNVGGNLTATGSISASNGTLTSVSFSRNLTSGTKIGTITIDGTATDLYCQTNTNTTYTIDTGDSNGQIKVTPSGGSAYNVSVKGLGSAAYTASTAYAAASHTHSYLPLTGGTLTGTLTVNGGPQSINVVASDTSERYIRVNNTKGNILLDVDSSGNHGLYSNTKGGWLLYANTGGNDTDSNLYVPRSLYCSTGRIHANIASGEAQINASNGTHRIYMYCNSNGSSGIYAFKADGTGYSVISTANGAVTSTFNGHATSDLPLTGGTLTGTLYVGNTNASCCEVNSGGTIRVRNTTGNAWVQAENGNGVNAIWMNSKTDGTVEIASRTANGTAVALLTRANNSTTVTAAGAWNFTGNITFSSTSDLGIIQGYNSTTKYNILRNHGNGNVSLSACSAGLYLGYENTTFVNFLNGLMSLNSQGYLTMSRVIANVTSGEAEVVASNGTHRIYMFSHSDGRSGLCGYKADGTGFGIINIANGATTGTFYGHSSQDLALSGGTLTGTVTINNNVYVYSKDSGGTARILTGYSSDNNMFFGYGSRAGSVGASYFDGHVVYIRSNGAINLQVGTGISLTGGNCTLENTTANQNAYIAAQNSKAGCSIRANSDGASTGLRSIKTAGTARDSWMCWMNSSGTIAHPTSSDLREKDIIGDIPIKEVEIVLRKTKLINFIYKGDTDKVIQNGVIAQNLRDVLIDNEFGIRSYLMIEDLESGSMYYDLTIPEEKVRYYVDYSKFTPILWKGWQLHDDRIKKLEKENEELKERINRLESRTNIV